VKHAVVVDRIRAKSWRLPSGPRILGPDWHLTVVTDRPGPEHRDLGPDTSLLAVPELTAVSLDLAVRALDSELPVTGISTTSELFLSDVARIRHALGLGGPGPDYTAGLRDKWTMKEIARRASVPCAEGVLGSELDQARALLGTYGTCVLKPRRLSGSRGVRVLRSEAELLDWARSRPDRSEYLVERFVHGPLMHLDGLVADGRVTWQLSQYERPTHICGGPTPLSSFTVDDPAVLHEAERFLASVLAAWRMDNDVFHCEAFATDEGFVLCEIAGRPGGAGVAQVFRATRGVDLRHAKTLLDLQEPLIGPGAAVPLRRAGGWTVVYAPGGVFQGLDEGGLSGHHLREVRATPGEVLAPSSFSGVGVATYTFLGDSTREVRRHIGRYEARLRVVGATERPAVP